MTVEAEALNPAASDSYMIEMSETDPTHQWVGYFESDSYLCYDDIDMTGVRSIDFNYARLGGLASFRIVLDDPANGTVLAEQSTEPTGGWDMFETLNVGLDEEVQGRYQLCFVGVLGSGIFNLDNFTLSDQEGTNSGPVGSDTDEIPEGPAVPAITTQGNQMLFGGQPDSIAGMSLFWSTAGEGAPFYTADTVAAVKNEWGADLIRVAMGVDAEWAPGGDPMAGYTASEAAKLTNTIMTKTVVNAAIANGMYVIIDWHTHYAEQHPAAAVEFFTEMATKYGDYDNVIYEVYNEPLAVSWSNVIKPYAENVIAAIRAQDPDNLIIVGTPNWSQDVDQVVADPINDVNVAYTLHFYAGTHKQSLRDKATIALNADLPLFVTEWGTVSASGDGSVDQAETNTWMTFLKDNGISHANWSLTDKDEGASALVPGASPAGGWSDSELTESGALVKDIIENW